jgi:hypothetical protein
MRRKHPDHISNPIIDIQVSAKANVVCFEEKPDARVEFLDEAVDRTTTDQPEVEAGSADERVNIPEELEPGIVYHDVRVRWHAAAQIADQEDGS